MIGRLLGHYRILGPLGSGGMGVVYRARDERLERDVAVKVLPDEMLADATARARLLREARMASALNHPGICTIYEVGEEGPRVFIAMELVEGRSLSDRIGGKALPVADVLRYGIQIADALDHAHRRDVIHRDLKGGNVMVLPEGRIKVLDFGLARRVVSETGPTMVASSLSLTETGSVVGTPQYMAPEVLMGQDADARSDLWALGVMLYEMVSGAPPFAGQTAYETAAAILHSPPGPLPESVPAGLRAAIARCLEKDPGLRHARAGEVRAALEALQSDPHAVAPSPAPVPAAAPRPAPPAKARVSRTVVMAAVGALVLLAVAVVVGRLGWWGALGARPIRALAVMPLDNLSRDPDQEYFADGMTDELITDLSRLASLKVIARGSVMGYKGTRKPLAQIARELGVDAVVEGSVMRAGERVRIRAELARAKNGQSLWADSYERDLKDVLALQADVARAIVDKIQLRLDPVEAKRLAATATVKPEAYQAYLKGRYAWTRYTKEGFDEAEKQFREALRIDPTWAPAWAGVADAVYGHSSILVAPNVAIPEARAAAEKALALDESLPEAHTSLGIVKMVYDWDWTGAEHEFDRAIALKPNGADAHWWRGHQLVCMGRFDEGLVELRRALELDPLSSWYSASVGWHIYFARRYDEAEQYLRNAAALHPDAYVFNVFLGLVLEQKGDHTGAVASLEKAVAMDANNDDLGQLAHAYGSAGRHADAEKTIDRMMEMGRHGFMPAANIALAYAGLGERDSSFRWFDRAINDHSELLVFLKVDPSLDMLRSDPRYADLLRRMHLSPEPVASAIR